MKTMALIFSVDGKPLLPPDSHTDHVIRNHKGHRYHMTFKCYGKSVNTPSPLTLIHEVIFTEVVDHVTGHVILYSHINISMMSVCQADTCERISYMF